MNLQLREAGRKVPAEMKMKPAVCIGTGAERRIAMQTDRRERVACGNVS
jgi:hypothetical protein